MSPDVRVKNALRAAASVAIKAATTEAAHTAINPDAAVRYVRIAKTAQRTGAVTPASVMNQLAEAVGAEDVKNVRDATSAGVVISLSTRAIRADPSAPE